jgi:hypothetical protein
VTTRGLILVCIFGIGSVDVSYFWEVEYEGLVISVFRGVGGNASVYVRIVWVRGWVSK